MLVTAQVWRFVAAIVVKQCGIWVHLAGNLKNKLGVVSQTCLKRIRPPPLLDRMEFIQDNPYGNLVAVALHHGGNPVFDEFSHLLRGECAFIDAVCQPFRKLLIGDELSCHECLSMVMGVLYFAVRIGIAGVVLKDDLALSRLGQRPGQIIADKLQVEYCCFYQR